MLFRVCRSKNVGVAGYAEDFWPVQSEKQTSDWSSYFRDAILVWFTPNNTMLWCQGQKVMIFMLAWKIMTLGPAKHEKVAIFRRKMSGFRMFFGFWECEARKNPKASWGQMLLTPTSFYKSIGREPYMSKRKVTSKCILSYNKLNCL